MRLFDLPCDLALFGPGPPRPAASVTGRAIRADDHRKATLCPRREDRRLHTTVELLERHFLQIPGPVAATFPELQCGGRDIRLNTYRPRSGMTHESTEGLLRLRWAEATC